MNKNKSIILTTIVFLAVLFLFFLSIVIRIGTRQILVKGMGISNSFTELVFFDLDFMNTVDTEDKTRVAVNWAKLYPFPEHSDSSVQSARVCKLFETDAVSSVKEYISSVEEKIEQNTTDYLMGYRKLCEFAGRYAQLIRWNFTSFTAYNNVLFTGDNYLTNVAAYSDSLDASASTAELKDYCASLDIDFLYVMAPSKICKYEDPTLADQVDFSNQMADEMLSLLGSRDVDCLDLRASLHSQGLCHHDMFFSTDHHWRTETGLWAAEQVMGELSDRFGYSISMDMLNSAQYRFVEYSDWFLGSIGKKVTLSRAVPDDINLIYPEFDTLFHYSVPTRSVDITGDFSVTYDMSCISEKDYYNKNPYSAYNYGCPAYSKYENLYNPNGVKLLVINHSYADCEIPFMAVVSGELISLDLRSFNGSVRSIIAAEKPDVVLVMYSAGSTSSIDWNTHSSFYDFR